MSKNPGESSSAHIVPPSILDDRTVGNVHREPTSWVKSVNRTGYNNRPGGRGRDSVFSANTIGPRGTFGSSHGPRSGTLRTAVHKSNIASKLAHSPSDRRVNLKVYRPSSIERYQSRFMAPQGPLEFQLTLTCVLLGLIISAAELFDWAPEIRAYNIVPYMMTWWCVIQTSRVLWSKNCHTTVPMYLSIIPICAAAIISREAHQLITVLGFACTLIVFVQSGSKHLHKAIILYTVFFSIAYVGTLAIMHTLYTDTTGTSTTAGRVLDPPINMGAEAVLLVSLGCIGVLIHMLHRFILKYAMEIIAVHGYLEAARYRNRFLTMVMGDSQKGTTKAELKTTWQVDLDSPLQKAQSLLSGMIKGGVSLGLRREALETLNKLYSILQEGNLYNPSFTTEDLSTGIHNDIQSWLANEVGKTSRGRSGTVPRQAPVGIDPRATNPPASTTSTTQPAASEWEARLSRKMSQSQITGQGVPAGSEVEAELLYMTKGLASWDFDIFRLDVLTQYRPLYFVAYSLFQRHDLLNKFNIQESVLQSFLLKVEEGYFRENPYHNAIHAADVTHGFHYLFTASGAINFMTPLDLFAGMLAAIIHDFRHPGLNNTFHTATSSKLAVLYNDHSVLENHHCASAFALMRDERYNIMAGLTPDQYKEARETIIACLMATDISKHFTLLGDLKSGAANLKAHLNKEPVTILERKDRLLILESLVHAADVSNPSKCRAIANKWTRNVMDEFYLQGDEERRRGLPISTFMDRKSTNEARCQLGFIDFICGPLMEPLADIFPRIQHISDQLQESRVYWKGKVVDSEDPAIKQRPHQSISSTNSTSSLSPAPAPARSAAALPVISNEEHVSEENEDDASAATSQSTDPVSSSSGDLPGSALS